MVTNPTRLRRPYYIVYVMFSYDTTPCSVFGLNGRVEGTEFMMSTKKVSGPRRKKSGQQDPPKPARKGKAVGSRQTKRRAKAKEPSLQPLEGFQELVSEPRDLPDSYGETRVDLLPVEPCLFHAYWEVSPVKLEKVKGRLGDDYDGSQAILRFYDVTSNSANTQGYFDVQIDLEAGNSYVNLQSPEKSYFVELGFDTQEGQFYPITRSSIAKTPPAGPAQRADEQYMLVRGDYDVLEKVPAPAAERDPALETQSPLAAEEDSSCAEIHEQPSTQGLPQKQEGSNFDLTEMTDKSFTAGISSRR